jgi:hypothetical protein
LDQGAPAQDVAKKKLRTNWRMPKTMCEDEEGALEGAGAGVAICTSSAGGGSEDRHDDGNAEETD